MQDYCEHGGIYSANPQNVKVDFSSNINPLGISPIVLMKIRKQISTLSSIYPDPDCKDLKNTLIKYLDEKISSESINIGNGATELIHIFARSFVRNEVVIPNPTFCEYELASKRMGAKINMISLKNWELDADKIIEKSKKSDVIFLCNPNNPTGLISKSIEKIIDNSDSSKMILIDESFIELVDNNKKLSSLIEKTNELKNIVVLRSMTKSFGLAGLRLGYCIAHPETSKKLSSYKICWNVNGLAQLAGISALNDTTHLKKAIKIIRKEREFMYQHINKLDFFSALQSDVNYYLIELGRWTSIKISNILLEKKGILVRDCSTFHGLGNKYIRVAVKSHKDNLFLLRSLEWLNH